VGWFKLICCLFCMLPMRAYIKCRSGYKARYKISRKIGLNHNNNLNHNNDFKCAVNKKKATGKLPIAKF